MANGAPNGGWSSVAQKLLPIAQLLLVPILAFVWGVHQETQNLRIDVALIQRDIRDIKNHGSVSPAEARAIVIELLAAWGDPSTMFERLQDHEDRIRAMERQAPGGR